MINMIMRAFSPKIIVHLNMCTSCVTHSSPIDGFSNLEFCCPYIITSAYYRPKNEEKTGLNYLMTDILDMLHFLTTLQEQLIPYFYTWRLKSFPSDHKISNSLLIKNPGYIANEDASAIMLTEMKIDRTRRTMDR